MRTTLYALALLTLTATPALAQTEAEPQTEPAPADETLSPFDREWAIATYATGQAGSYLAGGIGGRLRWEPFQWLGVEAYLEATLVDWPGGFRHDYPNGFNLYVPVRAGDFRFRPFFGFCDILSFIEPQQAHAPRADDVLFGVHGGAGVEWAVHSNWSLFADLQANFYMGHDRTVAGWTGGLGDDFSFFWNLQLNIGVQFHMGHHG